MTEIKKVTRKELEANNGKNGKPAYLVYKGKIYDVSESSFWLDGDHLGSIRCFDAFFNGVY